MNAVLSSFVQHAPQAFVMSQWKAANQGQAPLLDIITPRNGALRLLGKHLFVKFVITTRRDASQVFLQLLNALGRKHPLCELLNVSRKVRT